MTAENLELAQQNFQIGKDAFERGQYRQSVEVLEKAVNFAGECLSGGREK
jgi:hypothetical protein